MILVVLGRRGCGKTTEIKRRIGTLPRMLIFDTLAEYEGCGEVFYEPEEMISYVERKNRSYFRCVFRPMDVEIQPAFEYFMRLSWIARDCTCVIDEVDAVSSPISIPQELSRSIRYGRHQNVSLIAASRRAAEVPRLLTSQADEIVCFNQTEPGDLKYLEKVTGDVSFAQRVSRLPRYKYETFKPFESIGVDTDEETSDNDTEPNEAPAVSPEPGTSGGSPPPGVPVVH